MNEPSAALERIAYLLEAERAPTYKVRAFRRAAAVVGERTTSELERLARGGGLQELAGVGKSSARVVAEALAGQTPDYLAVLEQRRPPPLCGPAAALRAALRGDCHVHSDWSDGSSSIAAMAAAAVALGHDYAVLTDHSARLSVAHGLDARRLREQIALVAALNDELAPFRLLTGIEVDILEDGRLDQDEELLAALDLVVASVHSQLRLDAAAMTARMIAAVASGRVDVLGHCTGRLVGGRTRPPSQFAPEEVFAACAAVGTAIEINCRPERVDPPDELLAAALVAGCLFSIDSDSHAPGQLEWLDLGCVRAADAGIMPERVVNSWPLASLRQWTARSASSASSAGATASSWS